MDISILKKEIKNTIDSLQEQVHSVVAHSDKIPQIEMDIAMGNIRKLYEDFYILNKINQDAPLQHQQTRTTSGEKATKNPEPPEPPAGQPMPPINKEPETKKAEEQKSEPKPQVQAGDNLPKKEEDKKAEAKPVPRKESKQKLPEDPKRTADLFSGNNSTLADKFMSEQDKSLAAKMQKNKITDLKAAIGINEKFIFVNELFDGNMQEYNKIIEQLNSFSTRNQAMAVLNTLRQKYSWEEKNPQYKEFQKYIERRFNNE